MTYCLALRLHEGLVFLADTRTNAGVDNVGTYRKLHVFAPARGPCLRPGVRRKPRHHPGGAGPDRTGSPPPDGENLASCTHLFEAALYIGRLNREVAEEHRDALASRVPTARRRSSSADRSCPELPTSCSCTRRATTSEPRTSGRFSRSARASTASSCSSWRSKPTSDIDTATKIALGSMMSTARANLSVGPPYDAAVYLERFGSRRRIPNRERRSAVGRIRARCGSSTCWRAIADLPRISFGVDVRTRGRGVRSTSS